MTAMRTAWMSLAVACGVPAAAPGPTPSGGLPTASEPVQVVPARGLPVAVMDANNNLDIIEHAGHVYLAFRTAPSHFASAETELHLLRSTDEQTWTHELTLREGTDLREPRLLALGDRLLLYYAVLGTSSIDFEPAGAKVAVRGVDGRWAAAVPAFDGDFIPWRTRWLDGRPMIIGYNGGAGVYDPSGDTADPDQLPQLAVRWLTTTDGTDGASFVAGSDVVHLGGGSETDLALTDDGRVVAVMRNEAGDADGFGSKVCTAEAGAWGHWTCAHDPKKYDSPLVFAHGGRIWLIGRRNLTDDGHYDLGMDDRSHAEQALAYQAAYWNERKRCSLWEVDPDTRAVSFVLDLAGRGDTCFASILPLSEDRYAVYNYSSPIDADGDGDDPVWLQGQLGETHIYRQVLTFPASD